MAMTLLQTNELSSSASSEFTSDIDNTYKLYIFKLIAIHPSADNAHVFFQVNASGESGYNEPSIATSFNSYHSEADATALGYDAGWDQTNTITGTGNHLLIKIGNDNDQTGSGELLLFNPSSTVYCTHWQFRGASHAGVDASYDNFQAGYFGTTAAITEVQFIASTGNLDAGTIKMYGVG